MENNILAIDLQTVLKLTWNIFKQRIGVNKISYPKKVFSKFLKFWCITKIFNFNLSLHESRTTIKVNLKKENWHAKGWGFGVSKS